MAKQYTLLKIPIKEIILQHFDITIRRNEEMEKGYLTTQEPSLLFDQIERLRGRPSEHISEMILVTAKKNPKQESDLRKLLREGFCCNGIHFRRFGKSASQAKAGITAFICDSMYDDLYAATQMDIETSRCVISKYEAARCLVFSSCTLLHHYMPNIVIIDEYKKILPDQYIKYVITKDGRREIQEGCKDLEISPFDGCGCHEHEFMEHMRKELGLDYDAAGAQVRLPFIKGYSVYMPFRQMLREWGYDAITDIYGHSHPIDTIDCIWNISMFKGHGIFWEKYGDQAWTAYMETLKKYQFKLGISKYSHHIRQISRYTRMNFQYLQCLDLWNPDYISYWEDRENADYDILDSTHDGKIIRLARYTTRLFEKIIQGDTFYTYKYLGITDSSEQPPKSRYLEAALINDTMLADPAVRQYIYRKLQKAINEAKIGKIYASGLYHTGVGDMIGYLQYAAGEEPVGCLRAGELYSSILDSGSILSFRSPLVDPSEVNKARIVKNELTDKWFRCLKDQDIVMFNMYDISAPQQGGADFDGDIFFLCDDPMLAGSKIEKPIILDIEDKTAAEPKPYTPDHIVEYEIMTRDSRIGEITNAATSIENHYTTKEEVRQLYSDYASLLRIYQGKEIDFLKTGIRWHMHQGLRKYVKQLPWFLLHHYPAKMDQYKKLVEKNRTIPDKEDKLRLNAFHSPSPMNELCDYICTWEKKNIIWNRSKADLAQIRSLILRDDFICPDRTVLRTVRRAINEYADELRNHMKLRENQQENEPFHIEEISRRKKDQLAVKLGLEEETIANYVIYVSYQNHSVSRSLAWTGYGEYLIKNLKEHSDPGQKISIREAVSPSETSYEYLGKYYEMETGEVRIGG